MTDDLWGARADDEERPRGNLEDELRAPGLQGDDESDDWADDDWADDDWADDDWADDEDAAA
jgi:hypothetical protein